MIQLFAGNATGCSFIYFCRMRHVTVPVFIPELACPNRCVFCNQRNISGKQCQPGEEEVLYTIEEHLRTIPQGSVIEIGFFGGNFTGIERDLQENYLRMVQPYLLKGTIHGIRLSTRPDYIDREILEFLKHLRVTTVELGAQSLDDEVLVQSGRGHTADIIEHASRLITGSGLRLGLQMMLGLPGDSLDKALYTARKIISLGAEETRIYPTLVIRDTALEFLYRSGKYVPLSLPEAVHQAKEVVKLFEEARVRILRTGLHPSEGLINGDNLVAGPFHVSFGELVATALWREKLDALVSNLSEDLQKNGGICITVPAGQLNAAIGHQGANKKLLQNYYHPLKFVESPALAGRAFQINPLQGLNKRRSK